MPVELREVISPAAIRARIAEMGREISALYGDEPVVAVCVLKGAFMFFADLVRSLSINPEVDFLRVTSYGKSQSRTGTISLTKDLEVEIEGKHVLVVEDIVDTGHTACFLLDTLRVRRPRSLRLCSLIDKKERREVECGVDFVGFSVQEGFLVGYGLDFAELYRHLDAVCELVRDEPNGTNRADTAEEPDA